jgi:alkanesulfonate monooxygenase SsuD/methylene tetrahydromethanopterin reductase-like flavin-dependent oxidoreductase (luciferase family)
MKFAIFLAAHHLDGRSETQLLDDLTEQALVAEELGYDHVWLVEHHFNNYNLMPDPLQFAVRLFERTERIGVGVAVFILPNHHPLQLAGRIAQIDVLYPGRFETAVGRGSSLFEARKLGNAMDTDTSRAYFAEHLEVMTRGLKSDGDFSHHGEFFDFDDVTILPRPVTRPMPSLWLSGLTPPSIAGQVATARRLGVAPKIITSPFRNPMSELQKGYDAFEEALAEHGFERSEAAFAINRTTFVGETEADARAAIPQLIDIHRGLYAQLENNERYVDGRIEIRPVQNEVTEQEILDRLPWGTPEQVLEHVRQYERMGIDHFSAYFDLGFDQETVLRSMRLFSEHVIAGLRSPAAA